MKHIGICKQFSLRFCKISTTCLAVSLSLKCHQSVFRLVWRRWKQIKVSPQGVKVQRWLLAGYQRGRRTNYPPHILPLLPLWSGKQQDHRQHCWVSPATLLQEKIGGDWVNHRAAWQAAAGHWASQGLPDTGGVDSTLCLKVSVSVLSTGTCCSCHNWPPEAEDTQCSLQKTGKAL